MNNGKRRENQWYGIEVLKKCNDAAEKADFHSLFPIWNQSDGKVDFIGKISRAIMKSYDNS